mmetsp:Transcript_40180/g.110651  ORF Transcript_40180/g.110651 Transcript_40180/m.110651 type:complete len:288 (-) Transcript_40180:333-1196(-)
MSLTTGAARHFPGRLRPFPEYPVPSQSTLYLQQAHFRKPVPRNAPHVSSAVCSACEPERPAVSPSAPAKCFHPAKRACAGRWSRQHLCPAARHDPAARPDGPTTPVRGHGRRAHLHAGAAEKSPKSSSAPSPAPAVSKSPKSPKSSEAAAVALGGAAGGAARGVWPAGGGGARAPALGGGASKPPPGGGASTPVPNSRGFLGAPALLPGTLTLMESVSPSLSDRSRIGSVAARASISARSWSASFCRSTPFQWSCSVALKSYEKLRSRKPMPINAWRPLPSSILNTK